MGHYIEATEASFNQDVEKFDGVVLVDFWATWCGPCQMLAPIIEQLADQYKDDAGVRIVKVDVDQNPNLAEKFQVYSIPTIKFFKQGQIVDETVGVQPVTELSRRIEATRS